MRVLSGADVVPILERFGFTLVRQRGSHMKLRWESGKGGRVTISVPNHRTIKPGTLANIFRDACRAVPEGELRPFFFAD